MMITQRQATLALLLLLAAACGVVASATLVLALPLVYLWTSLTAVVCYSGLWVAYQRGFEHARPLAILVITIVSAISCVLLTIETGEATWAIIVSAISALIIGNSIFVGASGIVALLIVVLGTLSLDSDPYLEPLPLLIYVISVAGMVIARIVTDTHRREAEAAAVVARAAQHHAEANAQEIAQRATELEHANDKQQRLLDLVATLEMPAIPVADGVLLAPVIGRFDTARAQRFTDFLLQRVYQDKIKHVILDLTGMHEIEDTTIHDIVRLVQAVQLIGGQVTLSGLSAATAQHLASADMSLPHSIQITRSPQEALQGLTPYQSLN